MDMRVSVIIDGDRGAGAASALRLAAASLELDVLAVTAGADRPMMSPFAGAAATTIGARGAEESVHAWDALYAHAKARGGAAIIALGPLTSIAIALLRYPDLPRYVPRVITVDGGDGPVRGAPSSGFNYWSDPLAARIVFDSSLDLWVLGPDVAGLPESGAPSLQELAVACAIGPEIVRFEDFPVEVVADEGPQRGRLIVDRRRRKPRNAQTAALPDQPRQDIRPVHLAVQADADRCLGLLARVGGRP